MSLPPPPQPAVISMRNSSPMPPRKFLTRAWLELIGTSSRINRIQALDRLLLIFAHTKPGARQESSLVLQHR